MKISILKESLCIGGTERSAANISIALSRKHNVKTVLFDGSDISYPYGGELLDMKLPAKARKVQKIVNSFNRAYIYKKHIKEFRPDIVYQFISFRSPLGALKLKNCVKIVSARDFSALSNNIAGYKKRLDKSTAMICNSEYLRDYFVERYPEDKERIFTVNNIIEVDSIQKQAEEEVDERFKDFRSKYSRIVVSVGRFCKEKAFENLISSFSQVHREMPDTGLVLIGDGANKEKYVEVAKEYGISEFVYYTGYQKNPYKYMSKCDVFVLSSLSEGFPNVLAEAMALSMPVIAINCYTGPAEILMKDYDYEIVSESFLECDYGILTPHYNSKGTDWAISEMTKAIIHIFKSDEVMKKYRKAAVQRARDFSEKAAIEKFEEIFNKLNKKINGQSKEE